MENEQPNSSEDDPEHQKEFNISFKAATDYDTEELAIVIWQRDHWKNQYEIISRKLSNLDTCDTKLYEKKIDKLSTTINMKVKVIEEICTQLFKLEQEHTQQRLQVEQFLVTIKQELSSIKNTNLSVIAHTKHEVEKYKFVIDNKLADYQTLRLQMEHALISTNNNNEGLMEENEQLRSLVNSQKEMINELFRDRDLLKEETDKEVNKWKGISSLTVPLVELLNKSMESSAHAVTTPTVEQSADDLHTLVSTPPLTMTDTVDLKHESENGTTLNVGEKLNGYLEVTPITPLTPITPSTPLTPATPGTPIVLQVTQTTIIGTGASGHVDGYGKRACFSSPNALSFNLANTALFVAECGNRCIRKINLQDLLVSTVTDPLPPNSNFANPSGMSFSDEQQLLIVDTIDNIFTADIVQGAITTMFKAERNILKNKPTQHVLVDKHGFMYISYNKGILRMKTKSNTSSGSSLVTWAGGKKIGYKDGSFEKCSFNYPNGMCSLDDHTILVADTGNNVIRIVDFKSQMVETYCGDGKAAIQDGPLFECSFKSPRKLGFCERLGLVFVVEVDQQHLRVIDSNHEVVRVLPLKNVCSDVACLDDGTNITLFVADSEQNVVVRLILSVDRT